MYSVTFVVLYFGVTLEQTSHPNSSPNPNANHNPNPEFGRVQGLF